MYIISMYELTFASESLINKKTCTNVINRIHLFKITSN